MARNSLVILATLLAAGAVAAQDLTLDEAVTTALASNPSVQAAAARAEAEAARHDQARAHRWGRLDLAETFNSTDNPAEVFALTLNQERFDLEGFFMSDPNRPDALSTFITSLDLTVPVYTGGKLSAASDQAETMADAAELARGTPASGGLRHRHRLHQPRQGPGQRGAARPRPAPPPPSTWPSPSSSPSRA
jgi:outer membrane protein TolC